MQDNPRLFELAEQVMALSRNAIVMNLRFMDMAVFRLRAEPADTTLATDGRYLFYGPSHMLRRYMLNEALPARDYLHGLLHCVFRRPFIDTLVVIRGTNVADYFPKAVAVSVTAAPWAALPSGSGTT